MVKKERKKEKKRKTVRTQGSNHKCYQVSCTQVTLEGKKCNLETKNNLETAKFRGLEYFHNPNTY